MRLSHRVSGASPARVFIATLVFLVGLLALAPAGAANASDPVSLEGQDIVDQTGAITAERETVQNAIDALAAAQGVHLYVVYTDFFTNPDDREAWTDTTVDQNHLGGMDALLAIATVGGSWQLHLGSEVAVSETELSALAGAFIVPPFEDYDWAGVAIGTAEGIDHFATGAAHGHVAPRPVSTPTSEASPNDTETEGQPATGHSGDRPVDAASMGLLFSVLGGSVAVVVLLSLGAGVVVMIAIRVRRHKSQRAQRAAVAQRHRSRGQSVDEALLRLDASLSLGKAEYGFASAQFGEENVRDFADTVAQVERTLSRVSELIAELREAPASDTEDVLDSRASRILELCRDASAHLDMHVRACSDLRQIDLTPTIAVSRSRTASADLATREEKARDTLHRLARRFDAVAYSQASQDVENAHRSLEEGRICLEQATASLASNASIAIDVREADRKMAEAKALLSAPEHLEDELNTAAAQLPEAIARAQGEVNVARWAAGSSEGQRIGPLADVLEETIERTRSGGTRDPIAALRALREATHSLSTRNDEGSWVPRGTHLVP